MTAATTATSTHKSSAFEHGNAAFKHIRTESIESLNLDMEEYRHIKTGAVHYHLNSDNTENVFLVALRTVPMDSTGVAHILEHTALCGSRKYPVRDPFFMMIRRSLNTFMNAFTSSDWTAYPFASKNRKDFNNLRSVYLDAVFFSRLHELDFAQEGHRLEFEEKTDSSAPLQYKGVVYNEMKGAMSSINSVLWQTLSKYLFPTSTYHYNSGGEPEHIPDLKYSELKHFYDTHYHPSNAVFMTFGDIPAQDHQHAIEELALREFDKLDVHIAVTDEKRYLAPIRVRERYESDGSDEAKSHVVVAWLLGKSTSLDDLFRAQLLSSVLMDNSASPLLRLLETSELGSAPSPMCGLEDGNREMSFMAGLEGCELDATEAVETQILGALEQIAIDGVPQEQIEAALHQLELSQREISGDSYPYGLQLILAGLSTAMHRGDPLSLMNVDPVLEKLQIEIQDREFIPTLIRKLLLENTHRITLTMDPDAELPQRKIAAERAHLAAIRDALTPDEVASIIKRSQELSERQDAEDDPGLLPKVGLDDVPTTIHEPDAEKLTLPTGASCHYYNQGTNGLCYQQVVVHLPNLEPKLLQALPLFTSCITELGFSDKSYSEAQVLQSQVCGGINSFSSFRSAVGDEQDSRGLVSFSTKSLRRHHQATTALLEKTVLEARFDEHQRIKELVEQITARKESSITGQGHSLAMSLANSGMSPTARLGYQTGGLAGIRYLKELRNKLSNPEALAELAESFSVIHDRILAAPRQFLLIGEAEAKEQALSDLQQAWSGSSESAGFDAFRLDPVRRTVRCAWTTATAVNFCAKAYASVPASHPDNAVLSVLAGYLRNNFLHKAIREQGGAYGGGASQDSGSASFKFFSYRDPRLQGTLDDFDHAIEWMHGPKHADYMLEEAILGVISAMDKPSSPAGEAKQAFYNEIFERSLEFRMAYRNLVLNVTLDDLRRVTTTYLDPGKASIGIITNKELLQECTESNLEIYEL